MCPCDPIKELAALRRRRLKNEMKQELLLICFYCLAFILREQMGWNGLRETALPWQRGLGIIIGHRLSYLLPLMWKEIKTGYNTNVTQHAPKAFSLSAIRTTRMKEVISCKPAFLVTVLFMRSLYSVSWLCIFLCARYCSCITL